ncbi:glycosyltransferase [Ferruginibacter sp. HRS2-29]|uniref:glycosyltransferase n=1 Tax=Ferruginibacter sp. HRS2-29 TaxID=2487334 RepID=UPI0020CDBB32|nr:glycosyltransferase [Ferruginibacter sp. HRS2-29]
MSSPKKVLFISYDGMTDPLGQSQVIPYLQGLSQHGYTIFLLSCEKEQVFEKNKHSVQQLLSGYDIVWVPVDYTRRPPVLSTLMDIRKLKRTARKIHEKHSIDMVHTRPGIPSMVGLWMKKKMGVKFLNDIREFYADSRVDGGMWKKGHPLYRMIYNYFKKNEAEEVAQSDGIVCLTYVAEKIIRQWPEYKASTPLAVIPCSADLNLFDSKRIDTQQADWQAQRLNIQPGDFIISYLGSIGGWYMTAEMMQFCKRVSEKIPAAKFLFISPHHHKTIIDTAAQYGLAEDRIIATHASRKEVPALLSLSRYSLFFIKPCYSKQSSSPTKHGELMAMGIPVITNSGVGDVKEIVEKYEGGFVIDHFDTSSFDDIIDKMILAKFDRDRIRQGAEEFYSLKNASAKYLELYQKILN